MATLLASTSRVQSPPQIVIVPYADSMMLLGIRNYEIRKTNIMLSIAWNNNPTPVDQIYGRLLLVEAASANCLVVTEAAFDDVMAIVRHHM